MQVSFLMAATYLLENFRIQTARVERACASRSLEKFDKIPLDWARAHHSHYFVVDCDNFIQPHTFRTILKTGLPIVAPLLTVAEPHLMPIITERSTTTGIMSSLPTTGRF